MLVDISVDLFMIRFKDIGLVQLLALFLLNDRVSQPCDDERLAVASAVKEFDKVAQLLSHGFKGQDIIGAPELVCVDVLNQCHLCVHLRNAGFSLQQCGNVTKLLLSALKRCKMLHVGKNQPIHEVVKPQRHFIIVVQMDDRCNILQQFTFISLADVVVSGTHLVFLYVLLAKAHLNNIIVQLRHLCVAIIRQLGTPALVVRIGIGAFLHEHSNLDTLFKDVF